MKRSFAFFALVCAILFGCAATAGAQSKASEKGCQEKGERVDQRGMEAIG